LPGNARDSSLLLDEANGIGGDSHGDGLAAFGSRGESRGGSGVGTLDQRIFEKAPGEAGDEDGQEKGNGDDGEVDPEALAKSHVEHEAKNHPEDAPVNDVDAITDLTETTHGVGGEPAGECGLGPGDKADNQAKAREFNSRATKRDVE